MSTTLLELAREMKEDADRRAEQHRVGMLQAQKEAADLATYIAVHERLLSVSRPQCWVPPPSPAPTVTVLPEEPEQPAGNGQPRTVRKGSLVAAAAQYLKDKGPQTLKDIAAALTALGLGEKARDPMTFVTTVNTALWRRKDLFERRTDGNYHLLTTDFQIVD